ncbi:uncharacterized protein GIQ15_03627 [Arthroderma uncinatum]|uniref:uncharacterized protein n=1 Tax=Arthroderma uncinatum TaxID=74035 RepID=UPI00144AE595|nr:uncharacterized protein GIQ15_03627 [Arthroderma uncinatum]KAF3484303.1 hypothetical protein GIQ15_03627 [Arthroderma uncinatum]
MPSQGGLIDTNALAVQYDRASQDANEDSATGLWDRLLNNTFTDDSWIVTPQKRQATGARPDFVIERFWTNGAFIEVVVVEAKPEHQSMAQDNHTDEQVLGYARTALQTGQAKGQMKIFALRVVVGLGWVHELFGSQSSLSAYLLTIYLTPAYPKVWATVDLAFYVLLQLENSAKGAGPLIRPSTAFMPPGVATHSLCWLVVTKALGSEGVKVEWLDRFCRLLQDMAPFLTPIRYPHGPGIPNEVEGIGPELAEKSLESTSGIFGRFSLPHEIIQIIYGHLNSYPDVYHLQEVAGIELNRFGYEGESAVAISSRELNGLRLVSDAEGFTALQVKNISWEACWHGSTLDSDDLVYTQMEWPIECSTRLVPSYDSFKIRAISVLHGTGLPQHRSISWKSRLPPEELVPVVLADCGPVEGILPLSFVDRQLETANAISAFVDASSQVITGFELDFGSIKLNLGNPHPLVTKLSFYTNAQAKETFVGIACAKSDETIAVKVKSPIPCLNTKAYLDR